MPIGRRRKSTRTCGGSWKGSSESVVTMFDDIFGQDAAIEWLKQAYRADRLPHGLVFAGPTGVGKATTAKALATLFLCENPKGESPCSKCESCRAMAAGL